MVTRNGLPLYIAQGVSIGTPQLGGNTNNMNFGSATASGGLVAGLFDVPCASFFTLNDVISYSDFTVLFDQYRIKKVTLTFRITTMATSAAPGAGAAVTADNLLTNPTIFWFVDQDDSIAPTTADMRERMGVRSRQLLPGRPVTLTVNRPRVDTVVFNAVGGSAAVGLGKPSQWFDISQTNIPHQGIKWMIADFDARPLAGSTPTWQVTVEKKYWLEFKQVR